MEWVLTGLIGAALLGFVAYALSRRATTRAELQVLGEGLDAPALVVDRAGRLLHFNARFVRMCAALLLPAPERGVAIVDMVRDWHAAGALETPPAPLIALVSGEPAHDDANGDSGAVECRLVDQSFRVLRFGLSGGRMALVLQDISARVRLETALASSEAARHTLLAASPVPMLLTSPVDGRIIETNLSAAQLFGLKSEANLIGQSINDLYVDAQQREWMLEQLRQQGRADNYEVSIRVGAGEPRWFVASSRVIDVGSQRLVLSAANDVTRIKQVEAALRNSESQLKTLIEQEPIPILILGRQDQRVLFDNRQARLAFSGSDTRSRAGQVLSELYFQDSDRDNVQAALARDGMLEACELQLRKADGSVVWFHLSAVRVEYEGQDAVLFSMFDIDLRRQAEAQLRLARAEAELANRELRTANVELEQQASTDRLTGAFNRRHCEELALREMSRSRRYSLPLSVIMLDIDHFKRVNDTHGHAAGDAVLIEMVRLVRSHLRSSDVLARWGGEEFVVVAPSSSLDEAETLAEKLLDLARHHDFAPVGQVTISAGVSSLGYRDTLDSLMRRVDRALYQAKDAGRDCVRAASADQTASPG